MPIKIFSAIVAVGLVSVFLGAPVSKLRDVALGVTILIGMTMMLVDLWQSLQSKDD